MCLNRNQKYNLFKILRSKEVLILKLGQLIKYLKGKILQKNMLRMYTKD